MLQRRDWRSTGRFIAPDQEKLWSLARNLWWSWDRDTVSLFRSLARWRALNQNPIALLSEMPLAQIEKRAAELLLHSRINYAYRRLQEYLHRRSNLVFGPSWKFSTAVSRQLWADECGSVAN